MSRKPEKVVSQTIKKTLPLPMALTGTWALMPERLHAMAGVVMRWSAGVPAETQTMDRINSDRTIRESRRKLATAQSSGGIAVLPLYGVVTQRGNMVDDVSGPGSTSTQQFSSTLRQLLADETVGQILIDIDSPGGSVYGVAELADEIQSARSQKPIVAVANSLAASAAYWIGCAASEFYVTPGGEVGSIGVWQAHQDYSQALEESGVKTTLISAGKFKYQMGSLEDTRRVDTLKLQSKYETINKVCNWTTLESWVNKRFGKKDDHVKL